MCEFTGAQSEVTIDSLRREPQGEGFDEDGMKTGPPRPSEPEIDLSRRDLLEGTLALTVLPSLCCVSPQLSPSSVHFEGLTLVVDLARAPELKRVGSAAAVVDSARDVNILVARTSERDFAALDRTCTHGGAQCAYQHERRTVRCTSLNHAEYALDGTLLHGRTHGDLRAYETRCSGARLEIRLGTRA